MSAGLLAADRALFHTKTGRVTRLTPHTRTRTALAIGIRMKNACWRLVNDMHLFFYKYIVNEKLQTCILHKSDMCQICVICMFAFLYIG